MQLTQDGSLRNRKSFYYSNDDNKAEWGVFKKVWVDWNHERQ